MINDGLSSNYQAGQKRKRRWPGASVRDIFRNETRRSGDDDECATCCAFQLAPEHIVAAQQSRFLSIS